MPPPRLEVENDSLKVSERLKFRIGDHRSDLQNMVPSFVQASHFKSIQRKGLPIIYLPCFSMLNMKRKPALLKRKVAMPNFRCRARRTGFEACHGSAPTRAETDDQDRDVKQSSHGGCANMELL